MPNQVVAYNLQRARVFRRWTQEEAALHLEQFLGERWSRATVSAAERSVDGARTRHFDANDLIAFALTFRISPLRFLRPPDDTRFIRSSPHVAKSVRVREYHEVLDDRWDTGAPGVQPQATVSASRNSAAQGEMASEISGSTDARAQHQINLLERRLQDLRAEVEQLTRCLRDERRAREQAREKDAS